MPSNRALKDVLQKDTGALPASTTATTTTGLNLMNSSQGDFAAPVTLRLTAPSVSSAQLPNTKLMTYDIQQASDAAFTSPTTLLAGVIVQTGTGSTVAGSTYDFRVPLNVLQYVRAKVTPSASGTGDASAATMTLEILF